MIRIYLCTCEVANECPDVECFYQDEANQMSLADIILECERFESDWIWLSGGETTNHRLKPIITMLKTQGYKMALDTCGHMVVDLDVDFIRVTPARSWWEQRRGDELVIIPGINDISVDQFILTDLDFRHKYVKVLMDGSVEDNLSKMQCQQFVQENPEWQLF